MAYLHNHDKLCLWEIVFIFNLKETKTDKEFSFEGYVNKKNKRGVLSDKSKKYSMVTAFFIRYLNQRSSGSLYASKEIAPKVL